MSKYHFPSSKKFIEYGCFFAIIKLYFKEVNLIRREMAQDALWGGGKTVGEFKKVSDQVNIELIQSIQDKCSKAMGLAFVTVDYKGRPITKYSGFTDHCALGRELQGFSEMCEQCDAHGGLHAAITGQPYIYRCHADLVDFAVPLILDDNYFGSVMGGQVRLTDAEERELEHILPRANWNKNEAMAEAYGRLREMTYDKLLASVQVVRDMILYALQDQRAAQEAGEKEQPEEGAAQLEGEWGIRRPDRGAIWQEEYSDQFFFVMNLITQLAYQEGADRTGAVALDFADIIRYTSDTERKLSVLGEELNYAEAFLRVQKAWWGEMLEYSVSVPRQYWGVGCPFLIFRPILDIAVQSSRGEDDLRRIDIFAEENGKDLLVLVRTNSEGFGPEELESRADEYLSRGRTSLRELNRNLKRVMGKRCELSICQRGDGQAGCVIRLKLPLKWQ